MSLFKRTEINKDFSQVSKLIYGFPKSGKSTLCSFMKDKEGREPLFIATEDGHKALKVFVQRITDWDKFMILLKFLEDNKETVRKEHSCFVLDIISDLDLWLTRKICNDHKAQHIYDDKVFPYGKGTTIHKNIFQNAMLRLFNILPVNFIAHSKEKEIMWEGEKIKTQSPSLPSHVLEFINGKVDMIGWIAPARMGSGKPRIIFKGTDTCIAGSRYKSLAREFAIDPANPVLAYNEIQQIFEGEEQ